MKSRLFAALGLAALAALSGCASQQISPAVDSALVQNGVGPSTTVKMQNGQPLDYDDIMELVKKKVPAQMIVGYLQSTQRVYNFGPVQLESLQEAGAPSQVTNYLQETRGFYGKASPARRSNSPQEPSGAYENSPLYQDEQPFAYNAPLIDDWYDSAYEESLYSPFSYN